MASRTLYWLPDTLVERCCGGEQGLRLFDFCLSGRPCEELRLTASPDLSTEIHGPWTTEDTICDACHARKIEELLTESGGRWRVRCAGLVGDLHPPLISKNDLHPPLHRAQKQQRPPLRGGLSR